MRNHLKGEFLIQIEVTFLLIMIEIPGLWHFKANVVVFPSMIKFQLGGAMAPLAPPLDPPLLLYSSFPYLGCVCNEMINIFFVTIITQYYIFTNKEDDAQKLYSLYLLNIFVFGLYFCICSTLILLHGVIRT